MLRRIIEASAGNPVLVGIGMAGLLAWGGWALATLPVDAIPDLSDVQVIVFTEFSGQAPRVVEDQVTFPLSTAMLAVPHARVVRGYSFFGLSFVYVLFEDGTDLYWARSRVLEALSAIAGKLPDVSPALGPDATGVGWVYEYALVDRSGRHDLAELRSIQDWQLRYELQAVPGVAEVASVGGHVRQYQVEIDPNALAAFGISLGQVSRAVERSNSEVGGRLIEMAETEFMVRGRGYVSSVDDLRQVAVTSDGRGTPVLLRDIAHVSLGPELRRGLTDLDGEGEVVAGIVVMRFGENALATIEKVKRRLDELAKTLPPGIEIVPVYDRAPLIERAIQNLRSKLVQQCLIVALICVVFLFHVRSALVAIAILPLGILISFIVMRHAGINANIMSLGGIAIAIGTMIDAGIVMVENAHKHLERAPEGTPRHRVMVEAAVEVGPSLFFSLLIITVSFLPIFGLEAEAGRLFKPLAFTKTFAMAGAALLSITVVPVLMLWLVRGRIVPEARNPLNRFVVRVYRPLIEVALRRRAAVVALSVLILASTLLPLSRLGSEFMPPLDEGDLLYMPTTRVPGLSITKAREILQQTDRAIARFPEVKRVFGKVGRAETPTDPAPLTMIETTITLRPRDEWRPGMTTQKLIAELDAAVRVPGLSNAWVMPIRTRIDMLATGMRTAVGVKLAGPDLAVLEQLGERVEAVLNGVPGTASVAAERVMGAHYLDFDIDRREVARHGLTVGDVQDVIATAIGGRNVTYTVEGLERYPVNIRYSRELRDDLSSLRRVLVSTPSGAHVPIEQLARIEFRRGPPAIKTENARPNAWVSVHISDVDVGTYVERAQRAVAEQVELPLGYTLTWSGQYEYMQRAAERLRVIAPLTLAIIFLLLFLNFGRLTDTFLVLAGLPFALVGGVWLIFLLGYDTSVAVGAGFLALAGLSAETGVIMLLFLNQARDRFIDEGRLHTRGDLVAAIVEGATLRARPLLMTVASDVIGLLPIMWGAGTGSETMRRIAAPMVGGVVTATLVTLVVIPVLFAVVHGRRLPARGNPTPEADT